MTTNATTAEDRLAKLGIHLPDAPTPFGAYVPAVQMGNLLFLSGMLDTSGHTATVVGIVDNALDVKAGREAARTAALNVLALTRKQLAQVTGADPFRNVRRSQGDLPRASHAQTCRQHAGLYTNPVSSRSFDTRTTASQDFYLASSRQQQQRRLDDRRQVPHQRRGPEGSPKPARAGAGA